MSTLCLAVNGVSCGVDGVNVHIVPGSVRTETALQFLLYSLRMNHRVSTQDK
jgi:hypothetical protein